MPQGGGCSANPDSPGCLTDEEKDLLQTWTDNGTPETAE